MRYLLSWNGYKEEMMTDIKAPATRPMAPRPLSPHLEIYRVTWTMAMSIFHRITGSALYLGTLMIAAWLVAAASGRSSFETAQWAMGSLLGQLVLFGYTWALLHHMLGGVRHLIWDSGTGYERSTRMNLARFTFIGSVSLTIVVWAIALYLR